MADKPNNKSNRLVKNPDTFRERAKKAVESSGQPKRSERLRTSLFKPFLPFIRLIAGTFAWKIVKTVGSFIIPPYFKNSWKELKLVTWPSWKQSRQLTYAVLVFAVVFGTTIALVDLGLDKIFKNILLK
jgi:preprotein translocase SecE subunit